ncbi:MAG: Ig-like domain-containing protein, partial [Verrucomicrobiota bacterium]
MDTLDVWSRHLRTGMAVLALSLTVPPAIAEEPGVETPAPTGPFFNGVFPETIPGSTSGITAANAFPNLRFIGPVWLTDFPGTNDLVVTSKAGHIWRFPNDPDVTPDDVTVMLNFSKYAGKGVDWPANVLPDADHLPTVSGPELVISSVSFAIFNISFHPNFGQSGHQHENHVFISYMPRPPGIPVTESRCYFRVSRFTIVDDPTDGPIIDPASEVILINQFNGNRNHEGGAMFFGTDGFLWITHGDGGFGSWYEDYGKVPSQRLDGTLKGGVLRIDVDMQGGAVSHPIRRQPDDSAMTGNAIPPAGWPLSSTGNYYIPSDNPWVDPSPTSDVLEEFWALGLRSPHTMQQDPVTGDIWIGDVGGNQEEIHLGNPSSPAPNFGWRDINGNHPPAVPYFGTNSSAVLTIPRSVSTSVIGGYLYRDAEFPELQGKLLWADNIRNTVHAMDPASPSHAGQPIATLEVGSQWTGPANICRGPNGEVFITHMGGFDDPTDIEDNDGTIQMLAPLVTSPEPPARLSQTGAFLNLANLEPHPSFVPYGVLNPLWSDNSTKGRWIALSNDGVHNTPTEQITFSENGNWLFPEGTVLMKHFELPIDDDDPTLTTRLETRFIVCLAGGQKYGFTYRWRPDQSDADLLTGGETGDYTINDGEPGERIQTWAFPSRSDCLLCHNDASGQALGVRTHQLNGYYLYPDTGIEANQLLTWSHLGMFDQTLTVSQVEDYLQARGLDDHNAPLEHRVRSYIDSNCAHCHRPGGPGGNFDGRLSTPLLGQNIINRAPSFYQGLAPDGLYIKPDDIPNSIFHYRMDHALPSTNAMPPVAKNVVDENSVTRIASWIDSLFPADFPAIPTQLRPLLAAPSETTGDFDVTIVFDDDVSGLSTGDFSFNNGDILELKGSGHYYTARFRPNDTPVSFSLPGGAVTGDNTGLTNTGSTAVIVNFTDSEPPAAEFIDLPLGNELTGPVTIGIDFGKDVTGFSLGDLTVTNGSVSSLIPANGAYFFDLTPSGTGDIVINLAAAAVQDSQSRPNAAASLTLVAVVPDSDQDGLSDADEA